MPTTDEEQTQLAGLDIVSSSQRLGTKTLVDMPVLKPMLLCSNSFYSILSLFG